MTGSDFAPVSALALREAIGAGRTTAERVTAEALERAEALEPGLQAWATLDKAGALAAARALDQGPSRGILHGVPLGVKDLFAVKDLPWRAGSPIYQARVAGFDAAPVAMVRAAGGVVLGKTHTTEFASFTPAPTRNPRAPGATPGGSSSGSAAGVAAGVMPLAFGTQTSGSIIRPASYCGVVGFKPTFDLIDVTGVTPLARSLDTIGALAGSVADAALLVDAAAGTEFLAAALSAESPSALGLCLSPAWDLAEPELVLAWQAFCDQLGRKVRLCEVNLPQDADIGPAHARLMAHEAAQALAWENATARALISPALRAQIDEGLAQTPAQWLADRARLFELRARLRHLPGPARIWVTPATTGPAPDGLSFTGNPAFNRLWSFAGVPACTVPLLQDARGWPMGVQVVGGLGDDAAVIATAAWLERTFLS